MTQQVKRDADYIFYELTRSVCPRCLDPIDAQVLLKGGRVIMRKRCPSHGWFEALLSSDAEMYLGSLRYNKPGTMPLGFSTEVVDGCPLDCGLCPEHKQHTCLGLIEVNSHCNLDCPICFADAQPGFSLSMAQVERMLDRFVELEGDPEVVQFSGGEPTIHPDILAMLRMATEKGIKVVMLNANGIRIAKDDRFLAGLADIGPTVYLQFDGFSTQTHQAIRGKDLLPIKLKALDRLAHAKLDVVLVPAIEKGVNHDEIGEIVRFGIEHPAVRGIACPTGYALGQVRRFRPHGPRDRGRRDPRHSRADRRHVRRERLRAGALLPPDLPLGHVRFRRGRQGHAAPQGSRGRQVPGLHHQPDAAGDQTGGPRGAGGAVVGLFGARDHIGGAAI